MRIGKRRRGVSALIGTVFFLVIFMVAFAATVYTYAEQQASAQAQQAAQQLIANHSREYLTYLATGSQLQVVNVGRVTSNVIEVILYHVSGAVVSSFAPATSAIITPQSLIQVSTLIPAGQMSTYNSILASTNPSDSIGLLTQLGNTFWLRPAQAVQQRNPLDTYTVNFDALNGAVAGTSTLLRVDGVNYQFSQLPVTFTWFAGTQHTYQYYNLAGGTAPSISKVNTLCNTGYNHQTCVSPSVAVTQGQGIYVEVTTQEQTNSYTPSVLVPTDTLGTLFSLISAPAPATATGSGASSWIFAGRAVASGSDVVTVKDSAGASDNIEVGVVVASGYQVTPLSLAVGACNTSCLSSFTTTSPIAYPAGALVIGVASQQGSTGTDSVGGSFSLIYNGDGSGSGGAIAEYLAPVSSGTTSFPASNTLAPSVWTVAGAVFLPSPTMSGMDPNLSDTVVASASGTITATY